MKAKGKTSKKDNSIEVKNEKTSSLSKKQKIGAKVKPSNSQKKTEKNVKKSRNPMMKQLEGLKDIDPEFYSFLKQNDKKLLEFNILDSDDDNDGDVNISGGSIQESKTDESDDEDQDEKFHKPSSDLEVPSDESDFEDDNGDSTSTVAVQKVTLNLLNQWQLQLQQTNVCIETIRNVIKAFNSALASISVDGTDQELAPGSFKVVGSATFNGVLQLCVLHLYQAILRFLGLTSRSTIQFHKTKKWVKVRGCLRYYLTDLIRLIEHVSSPNILSVLLKHLHQMVGGISSFSTLSKTILKRLVVLWSTEDETVRVLAFLCILKITRNQQISMLHHVLKAMYLSYIRNSKFVSPNTLPGINFMRRSLVEMFALDLNVSYQHAFLYIRQLAINLRNAVILKKKDSLKTVYNWQFINSLRLWSDLLGATANKAQLQQLVYPLVTIVIGTIRLIPTAQYFPLRFHCIQTLISLAKETNTFVLVLPLILEVLCSNTFNKKHTAVSMRPMQFTCILRLNKPQLAENGFRDEVVDQVCNLILEYLTHESSSLAYTDLIVPTVVLLKTFLKKCRISNHTRKLKQLLDKIQENSRFIDTERRKITFGLQDLSQVQSWETQLRNKGTPLSIYYQNWVKIHETKKRRQVAQTGAINSDYDLPSIKRKAPVSNSAATNENGPVDLFPSDSENEHLINELEDDDNEYKPKAKKKSAHKELPQIIDEKEIHHKEDQDDAFDVDGVDIVKDLDLNDW